jgi:hypothetical protein
METRQADNELAGVQSNIDYLEKKNLTDAKQAFQLETDRIDQQMRAEALAEWTSTAEAQAAVCTAAARDLENLAQLEQAFTAQLAVVAGWKPGDEARRRFKAQTAWELIALLVRDLRPADLLAQLTNPPAAQREALVAAWSRLRDHPGLRSDPSEGEIKDAVHCGQEARTAIANLQANVQADAAGAWSGLAWMLEAAARESAWLLPGEPAPPSPVARTSVPPGELARFWLTPPAEEISIEATVNRAGRTARALGLLAELEEVRRQDWDPTAFLRRRLAAIQGQREEVLACVEDNEPLTAPPLAGDYRQVRQRFFRPAGNSGEITTDDGQLSITGDQVIWINATQKFTQVFAFAEGEERGFQNLGETDQSVPLVWKSIDQDKKSSYSPDKRDAKLTVRPWREGGGLILQAADDKGATGWTFFERVGDPTQRYR